MEPTSAAIMAGGSILGGVLGRGGGASHRAQDFAMQQMWTQRDIQEYFLRHGTGFQVQAAQEAGVHPLFALGGGGSSFNASPIAIPGQPGSDLGIPEAAKALAHAETAEQTQAKRTAAEMMRTESAARVEKDQAQAAYYWSLAAREQQAGRSSAPAPTLDQPSVLGVPGQSARIVSTDPVGFQGKPVSISDFFQIKPADVTSARRDAPHVASGGAGPGSKEYRLTRGLKVLLPAANDLGEALEPLSESVAAQLLWYRINVAHYGKAFTSHAWQELGFKEPNPAESLRNEAREQYRGFRDQNFGWLQRYYQGLGDAVRRPFRQREESRNPLR